MPDTVNITVNASPVTVAITETAAPVAVAVTPPAASPVTVAITEASPGVDGPPGANAEIVLCANLAAYLALAPEVQMDGRWYVIPK